MAYEALVTRIRTRPHPKADRLQLGTCAGHQVVVGLDTQDGELGVFFPTDGQLSEQMVLANNLYSKSALDKLGLTYDPVQKFGFFSERRRVRSQSFRGEKSDGFWVPLTYLAWLGDIPGFCEGMTFTELNGQAVCNKYETPATKRMQGRLGHRQRENMCFPKHDVTKQFRYVGDAIPANAVLYITEKLHGTSGRYGRVLDDNVVPWLGWLIGRCLGCRARDFFYPPREYRDLNGSKNVILEKSTGAGYYGTNAFRYRVLERLEGQLHKGEILYYEIVGSFLLDDDARNLRHIMDPQPIKDDLKSLRAQYGDEMVYRYGTAPGETDLYVYRIARMNEDGIGIDLSWPQVKARCKELGVKHVPELVGPYINPEDSDCLHRMMDTLTDGPSTLDPSHIREGVVLRVEHEEGISYVKNKSWTFGVLEGYIKDSDTYVDTEEVA